MSVHSLGRPLRRVGHALRKNNLHGRVGGPGAKAAPAAAPAPVEEAVEEAVEEESWSMSNTKAQLLAAAADMGVGVDNGMTKTQILAAIEAA